MPTTDSGRSVTAAIWVTGMAEVLVASTASDLQILSSARNTSCLISSRSKTASTTMSASAAASRSVVGVIRPSVASTSDAVDLALLGELLQRLPDAVQPPRGGRVVQVPQRHLPARLRRHLGDAGTHQPGPDDRESTRHLLLPRCD